MSNSYKEYASKEYVDSKIPSVVTTESDGLMSSADKAKLDGIQEGAKNSVSTISTKLTASEIMALENGLYYFTESAWFPLYLYDSWNQDETAYVSDVSIYGLCRIESPYIYVYEKGTYYYLETRVYDGAENVCCATEYARQIQDCVAGMYQLGTRPIVHVILRQYSDGSIEYENNNNYIEYLRTFGWSIAGILTQCTIHTNNTNYDFELYEVEKLVGDDEYLTGIKYAGYKDGYRYDVLCDINNITVTKTEMITTTATTSKEGLMSSADKSKLDGIAEGANKTIVDTSVSDTSTNPVANQIIKSYVDTKVAGIVESAPETLDTLNELAAALGDDPNFATTVANQIGTKVDKVDGKGLSTNDYTTAEKEKLAGITTVTTSKEGLMSAADKSKLDGVAEGANKTTIDAELNAASTNPVQNKTVNEALGKKLDSENPSGTGSLSLNRKTGTEIGLNSVAVGSNNTASGKYSEAHGYNTTSTNEGSHAEGHGTTASGYASHSEGLSTNALGGYTHAEGYHTTADSMAAHAEGYHTQAIGTNQHVQGRYNAPSGTLAHIVGNGEDDDNRSNAHTLDWDGNAWFAGDVKVGGTGQDDTTAKTLATTDVATAASNGLMSSTDKAKVDTVPASIADTTYTAARYRASALVATETDPTVNGVINWTYE